MIKGIIDSYELWQSRPENLNENMEDLIESAENRGWNQCNRSWIKTIKEQPRVDEWIPCNEPPKYTGDYLVTVGINRDGLGMYDEVRTANYNTFYEKWTVHEDWTNAIGTNPIAWMSLPPAYKEDKE